MYLRQVLLDSSVADLFLQSMRYTRRTGRECGFKLYYHPRKHVTLSSLIKGDRDSVDLTSADVIGLIGTDVLHVHTHPPTHNLTQAVKSGQDLSIEDYCSQVWDYLNLCRLKIQPQMDTNYRGYFRVIPTGLRIALTSKKAHFLYHQFSGNPDDLMDFYMMVEHFCSTLLKPGSSAYKKRIQQLHEALGFLRKKELFLTHGFTSSETIDAFLIPKHELEMLEEIFGRKKYPDTRTLKRQLRFRDSFSA